MKKVRIKINTCSRCGSAARVGTVKRAFGETLYYVKCAAKCSDGFTITGYEFTREEAINSWNSSYGMRLDASTGAVQPNAKQRF